MSQHDEHGRDGDAPYPVGYRKPPIEHRFKPGQSGNRKGRPKKSRSLEALLDEALDGRIEIKERGQSKSLPVREVIVKRVVASAVNGDPKAIETLMKIQRNRARPEPIQFEEEIERYFVDFIDRLEAARHQDYHDEEKQQDFETRLPDDDVEN